MPRSILTTLKTGPMLEYADSLGRSMRIRVFDDKHRLSIGLHDNDQNVVIGIGTEYAKELADFLVPLCSDFHRYAWKKPSESLPPFDRRVLVCYRYFGTIAQDVAWRVNERHDEYEWMWYNEQHDCEYCDPSVVLAWSELPSPPGFIYEREQPETA